MVPSSLHERRLLPSAVHLYVWYCGKADNNTGQSWWSVRRTAETLGVSIPTITRGRKALVQAGLITIQRRGLGNSGRAASIVTIVDHPSKADYLAIHPGPPPVHDPLSPADTYHQDPAHITSGITLISSAVLQLDLEELESHDPNAVSISEASIQVTNPTRTGKGQDQDNVTQAELIQLEERAKAQEKVKADTQAFRIRAKKVTTSQQFRRWIIPLVVFVSSTTIVLQCADSFDRDVLIEYLPRLEQVAAHLWPGLRLETTSRI